RFGFPGVSGTEMRRPGLLVATRSIALSRHQQKEKRPRVASPEGVSQTSTLRTLGRQQEDRLQHPSCYDRAMAALRTLETLRFDNTFARLPEVFYAKVTPTPLKNPFLVSFNPEAAALIDLDPTEAERTEFAECF